MPDKKTKKERDWSMEELREYGWILMTLWKFDGDIEKAAEKLCMEKSQIEEIYLKYKEAVERDCSDQHDSSERSPRGIILIAVQKVKARMMRLENARRSNGVFDKDDLE